MSDSEDEQHKYPCVYSMNQNGIVYKYSNNKSKGHFGVKKVIISKGRHPYPFYDKNGNFGMTENSFAIQVSSDEEGNGIVTALNTNKFKELLKSTKWGSFQIDYRMFKYFKKDFWKEFI